MTSLSRPRPRRGVARPHPTPAAGAPGKPPAEHKPARTASDGTEPLLYTAEQAADLLQVRPSWLRRKAAARAVPCRYVGKHLRFSRADITAIAEASAQPPQHRRRTRGINCYSKTQRTFTQLTSSFHRPLDY